MGGADMSTETHWYRAFCSARRIQSTFDFNASADTFDVSMLVDSFTVLRHTPKGVWIWDHIAERERFLLRLARKSFAYPTKELAIDSLQHRARWRVVHLKAQMEKAQAIFDATRDMSGLECTNLTEGNYRLD